MNKNRLLNIFLLLSIININHCFKPKSDKFNHNRTLFPLTGIHKTVPCRECHKDGALNALPTSCDTCHPMSSMHTKGLGDCTLCHNTVTFSVAFFNHKRKGIPLGGAHLNLVAESCNRCHKASTYSTGNPGFTCAVSGCHDILSTPHTMDSLVHTSPTQECQQCHNQFAWSPAAYPPHNSYPTKLIGSHNGISCGSCHLQPFNNWFAINYRDGNGGIYQSCARCHTRDYAPGHEGHSTLANDANCGRCHGYSTFDD